MLADVKGPQHWIQVVICIHTSKLISVLLNLLIYTKFGKEVWQRKCFEKNLLVFLSIPDEWELAGAGTRLAEEGHRRRET